jgi:hypothetical protein
MEAKSLRAMAEEYEAKAAEVGQAANLLASQGGTP